MPALRPIIALAGLAIAEAADAASTLYGGIRGSIELNPYLATHGAAELVAFKVAAIVASAIAIRIQRPLTWAVAAGAIATAAVAVHNITNTL